MRPQMHWPSMRDVGIVTRGYGGGAARWPQDVTPSTPADDVGDEAVLLSRCGAIVVAGPDRVTAARRAIELVRKKRDDQGRWPLENPHPGPAHFEMEGGAGEPSRWNTLRALRVLRWSGAA